MDSFGFHPVIAAWFRSRFDGPTEPQEQGWPHIAAGDNTLIAAPTGSGKTLTAFLASIDRLFRQAETGELGDEMQVVYVSPLRALSNDMHRNLEQPLREIHEQASAAGLTVPEIRVGLRTGDTSSSKRASLVRRPPHIFVTTPESLYLMLTAEKGREALKTVRTVIVDEIHALIRDKRGSHLALTMERLEALVGHPLQRIGLSATQKPIERVAKFLVGHSTPGDTADTAASPPPHAPACTIVDIGHSRELDLAIEVPPSELGAVCMHEQWGEVNERLVELINEHRSTLIFVNTRRMAERVTHQLTELLGDEVVGAHHGSLAADIRLTTERRLKDGELKAVVATASLELGIDVGFIDLVIQLGSPRAIAAFLQRIGRSGHALGLVPKGRLFALSRDELLEAMALIRAVKGGRLDAVRIPEAPLDILAQQIVAETTGDEWDIDALFDRFRRAWPFRDLKREDYDRTIEYLSEGITHSHGRSRVLLHVDRVGRRLKARKGARITATSNGGAIPEIGSFRVVADPDGAVVGTLDEDFAIESNRGDIFLLGNTSWRILHVRGNDVTVVDAQGAPPTVPFWRGEAPGRTLELSDEISRLRQNIADKTAEPEDEVAEWLAEETNCSQSAAEQAFLYVAAQKAALGLVPTQSRVVFERFFDETGGMQLVVHAPFGGDINRAWAFAMRKRFCRSFDFELQATADDNGFILSLGPQHSFPIESLFPMLNRRNARGLLEQAVLTTPLFQMRWRWNVSRALLVDRMRNGKKVPPALQRFRADDLLTAVFPKLTGCQEEHTGDHEVPDHPLTNQTMHDSLHEALDLDGLNDVLDRIEGGDISLVARDTREPSPFSYELLNANVYAFLDGGEIQERRARAVSSRRSLTVETVQDLARLDPEAIRQVREEARPLIRDADELHDALLGRIVLFEDETEREWQGHFDELIAAGRATVLSVSEEQSGWVATERLPAARAVFPDSTCAPDVEVPSDVRQDWTSIDARTALVRGMVEVCGPATTPELARRLAITGSQAGATLESLEAEGIVLRGHFEDAVEESEDDSSATQWCHRRLLARIHRLTIQGLRREIEPVEIDAYMRFLFRHHGLLPDTDRSGTNGVFDVVAMLQGLDLPALSWEGDILPARVTRYRPEWLDELCLNGEVGWGRLYPPERDPERGRPMASLTRVAPVSIWLRSDVGWLLPADEDPNSNGLSSPAEQVFEMLQQQGAMFSANILSETRLLPAQLDDVLGELITRGQVTADGFSGLRRLLANREAGRTGRRNPRAMLTRTRTASQPSGRWSLWRGRDGVGHENPSEVAGGEHETVDAVEQWAWQLLRRWGVVFRDLLSRESGAPSWYQLLQVYRRLEARGEIRGGRFVIGVGGEQFAASDTVRQLRAERDEPESSILTTISAADPLNLVGIIDQQSRVPATASNRIVFVNGVPIAALQGGCFVELSAASSEVTQKCRTALGLRATESESAEGDAGDEQDEPRRNKRVPVRSGIPRPMIS